MENTRAEQRASIAASASAPESGQETNAAPPASTAIANGDSHATARADENQVTTPGTTTQKMSIWYSLQFRGFRFLWLGTLFTSTANWVQQSTLGYVVYDLTGSGGLLGAIHGVRAIPTLLLMPFTGVATDRFSRGTLMVSSQVPLIFLNAGLAIGLFAGKVELWHLYIFVILTGIAMSVNQPARQTAVFDLVPREGVPNAVALNQTAMGVTRALGPGAAGFLLGAFGAGGNFLLQAVAYVGVSLTTWMIVFPPHQRRSTRRSFFRDSAEGFKYVGREPLARLLMFMSLFMPTFIIPTLNTLMPVFAKDVYHMETAGFSYLVMAIGIGNFAGAFYTSSLGRFERRGFLQLSSLMVTSLSLFGFAFAPNIYLGVPLLFICGFAEMIFLPTNTTLMQLSVPDEMRGRITSILLLNPLLIPLGSLLVGVGVDGIGGPAVVALSAGTSTVLGTLVWIGSPRLRNLTLTELEAEHARVSA